MTKLGKRSTRPRKLVFESLRHFKKPVSVKEIYQYLKSSINLTSVYRTVELMKCLNIVNEVEFGDDKKRYELTDTVKHHHHLICKHCGYVEDIETDEKKLFKVIKHRPGFLIEDHRLEFFGLCKNCR